MPSKPAAFLFFSVLPTSCISSTLNGRDSISDVNADFLCLYNIYSF
jgi:hypothetical protein